MVRNRETIANILSVLTTQNKVLALKYIKEDTPQTTGGLVEIIKRHHSISITPKALRNSLIDLYNRGIVYKDGRKKENGAHHYKLTDIGKISKVLAEFYYNHTFSRFKFAYEFIAEAGKRGENNIGVLDRMMIITNFYSLAYDSVTASPTDEQKGVIQKDLEEATKLPKTTVNSNLRALKNLGLIEYESESKTLEVKVKKDLNKIKGDVNFDPESRYLKRLLLIYEKGKLKIDEKIEYDNLFEKMNYDGELNRAYFPKFMRKLRREGYFEVSKPRREGSKIYLTELGTLFARNIVIPIYRFVFLGSELESAEKQARNNSINLS